MVSLFQALIGILLLVVSITTSQAAGQTPTNDQHEVQLKQINENLYGFSAGDQSGVLLVGQEAIALGDPLDMQIAAKLDSLIKAEFGLPVKYVFYSRASAERAAGAQLFRQQGALLVAHKEAMNIAQVQQNNDLPKPDILFESELTLHLGDERLQLMYLGKSLTADSLVAWFPQHDAIFAGDMVQVESLAKLSLKDAHFPNWFSTLDKLARLDFSYLITGQNKIGIRSDTKQYARFLRELYTRVNNALEAGAKDAEIVQKIQLRRYANWDHYAARLEEHVVTMIKALKPQP